MNDTLPAAFAQVPMEVVFAMMRFPRTLATPEERGGAALAANYLVYMRDPNIARVVAEQAEKVAKRGKNG